MRTILIIALCAAMAAVGCVAFNAIVFRTPTACEKLCDRKFVPGALAVEDGPQACVCWYKDPRDEQERHLPATAPRFSRSATARITCTPSCADAAAQLK